MLLAVIALLALTRAELVARMKAPVLTMTEGLVKVYADCPEDMRRDYQMPVARFAADVWLNRVVAWGAPDEMKRRYPQAKALHATRAQCPYEPLALVYQNSGGLAVAVIQPDDAMRRHILDVVRQTTKK